MARLYSGRKAARKGGLLVRENPITRIESVNSLYCLPVKETVTTAGVVCKTNQAGAPKLDFGDSTVDAVNRISSAKFSSKSPFTVKVTSTNGGNIVYQCPGQSICKIVFPKETSVPGNAAALSKWGTSKNLIWVADCEDQVDITFNVVVDSALD
jgi:hypothetical protein